MTDLHAANFGFMVRIPVPLSDSVAPDAAIGAAVIEIAIGQDAQLKITRRAVFLRAGEGNAQQNGHNIFTDYQDALARVQDGRASRIDWTTNMRYYKMRTAASVSIDYLGTTDQPVLFIIRLARTATSNKHHGIRFATNPAFKGPPFSGGQASAANYMFSPRYFHNDVLLPFGEQPPTPTATNGVAPCTVAAMVLQTGSALKYQEPFNIYLESAARLGTEEVITPVIFDPDITHPPGGGGVPLWP